MTASLILDSFRAGHIRALQPEMTLRDLDQPLMRTVDPVIVGSLSNVVRMWARSRTDVPGDYAKALSVEAVSRQPLTFLIVEAEQLSRSIEYRVEPFSGTEYDARPWPTTDVFQLAPLPSPSFPQLESITHTQLAGQQQVRACGDCQGAGRSPCPQCLATGDMPCPGCQGTQRATCPQCYGSGTHLGARGRLIQCTVCRTRGTVRCGQCSGGSITCTQCQGQRLQPCQACRAAGNLLSRPWLRTATSTNKQTVHQWGTAWPLDVADLCDDCGLVNSAEWQLPSAEPIASALRGVIPDSLLSEAALLVQQVSAPRATEPASRPLALRASVRSTYLYQLECDYDGRREFLVLAGRSGRVYSQRGPRPAGRVRGFLHRVSRFFASYASEPTEVSGYQESVSAGQLHVSDSRRVVPDAARSLGFHCEVTADGYAIHCPDADETRLAPGVLPIEVSWSTDSTGRVMLCTQSTLGALVNREVLPELLARGNHIRFGRYALIQVDRGRVWNVVLVDRRPYTLLQPSEYAFLLKAFYEDRREAFALGLTAPHR